MNFTISELVIYLLVAGISGSIAQSLVGYSRGGCLVSIVLGFIGALLGQKLATVLGMPEPLTINVGGNSFPVVWSIVGATLFVAGLSFLTSRRRRDGM